MTLQVQRLSREELYARVWSEPISKLAMKLGISDVGLAKACRRANVPVPERGYWARLAAGQRMRWTPLPQQEEGMPHRVKFKVRSAQSNTNWAGVRTEPAN
jgi:hypothetical protein